MNKPEKLPMRTPDIADDKFTALAEMFPGAVTETIDENGMVVRAIDADILAQEINTHVVSGKEERYQFTWPDKKKSILLANAPIAAALRPCREESVDFDNTENLYIEGDNLDVLKLLRETYLNRVKMIYIDPPYNTGNDFIYKDDFSMGAEGFLLRDGQYDEDGNRMVKNFDSNGRFHTDWLNMMYPRLRVARDLLAEDGVIFISIDDNEVENLKKICNEVFGEINFVAVIVWQKKYAATNDSKGFSTTHDYIIVYQKSSLFDRNLLPRTEKQNKPYKNDDGDGKGLWRSDNLLVKSFSQSGVYPIENPNTGEVFYPPEGSCWRASKDTMQSWLAENRIFFGKDGKGAPQLKRYLKEVQQGRVPLTWWPFEDVGHNDAANKEVASLFGHKTPFDTPKPTTLVRQMLLIATNPSDIILDFFSGSATTAHAVMQLNAEDGGKRKFIMVQLPELTDEKSEAYKAGYKNICEIGKERIRRAGTKIKEEMGLAAQGLDIGFRVLKLDSSNMKKVNNTPEEYAQINFDIDGFIDNIKSDRSGEDLLFQVMLDLGVPLSAKIEQKGRAFYVNDNYLIAYFDKADTDIITEIAKKRPYYAVFRDSSFKSDSDLVNFEQVFNTYSPNTIRRVL
jgi:adenine-specific DNA-methyltransferase